jgi:hypothetical protein
MVPIDKFPQTGENARLRAHQGHGADREISEVPTGPESGNRGAVHVPAWKIALNQNYPCKCICLATYLLCFYTVPCLTSTWKRLHLFSSRDLTHSMTQLGNVLFQVWFLVWNLVWCSHAITGCYTVFAACPCPLV